MGAGNSTRELSLAGRIATAIWATCAAMNQAQALFRLHQPDRGCTVRVRLGAAADSHEAACQATGTARSLGRPILLDHQTATRAHTIGARRRVVTWPGDAGPAVRVVVLRYHHGVDCTFPGPTRRMGWLVGFAFVLPMPLRLLIGAIGQRGLVNPTRPTADVVPFARG